VPARPRRRSTFRLVRLSRSCTKISPRRRLSSKFLEPMTIGEVEAGAARAGRGRRKRRSATARALTPAPLPAPPAPPPGEGRQEAPHLEVFAFLPSPGGRVGGAGRGAGVRASPMAKLQKLPHIPIRRPLHQLLRRPELKQPSFFHDANPSRETERFVEIVSHQDHRLVQR